MLLGLLGLGLLLPLLWVRLSTLCDVLGLALSAHGRWCRGWTGRRRIDESEDFEFLCWRAGWSFLSDNGLRRWGHWSESRIGVVVLEVDHSMAMGTRILIAGVPLVFCCVPEDSLFVF